MKGIRRKYVRTNFYYKNIFRRRVKIYNFFVSVTTEHINNCHQYNEITKVIFNNKLKGLVTRRIHLKVVTKEEHLLG